MAQDRLPVARGQREIEETPDDLLVLSGAGDVAAFERLYRSTSSAVHGLALRVLQDPAHAEEVAQEVLVEVWRSADRFDPARGSAKAWILALTHRRAVDRVRSVRAAADRDQRAAAADSAPGYDQVVEAVEIRLEQQQVRRCLGRLTERQRETVRLAYYDGHTQREVAELLRVPVPTVKTRLRDGLLRLKNCLGVT